MVLISFKDLYDIHIFPEFHRCGSKIVPAMPFWNLNFKWAWQAQFLSHNLLSLQNCLFFTNKEMMLMSFFEINDGIWDKNFACHCHIHFLSHPWPTLEHFDPIWTRLIQFGKDWSKILKVIQRYYWFLRVWHILCKYQFLGQKCH